MTESGCLYRFAFRLAQVASCLVGGLLLIQPADAAETKAKIPQPADAKPIGEKAVEVVFVLDTTGSMSGLIQGAKDKIWSVANEIMTSEPTPRIKFGLIGYRDRNDTYVTKAVDLTEDLDAIHTELMAFQAAGGGDTPESVNQALHEAVSDMSWSSGDSDGNGVLKLVFLVGDAPPHMDYPNDIKYPVVCDRAIAKRLIINTIQCGNIAAATPIWKEIASRTEGEYAAIQQDGGTQAIATPFDGEIARVNGELNATIVGYGLAKEQAIVQSKIAANAASCPEAIADRASCLNTLRARGEMSGKVLGGGNDLTEQLIQKKIALGDVDSDKLPEDLKKLPRDEQLSAIEARVSDRLKLQEEIDKLVKKRSDFLAKAKEEASKRGEVNSFDVRVKRMIQAHSAGAKLEIEKASPAKPAE